MATDRTAFDLWLKHGLQKRFAVPEALPEELTALLDQIEPSPER